MLFGNPKLETYSGIKYLLGFIKYKRKTHTIVFAPPPPPLLRNTLRVKPAFVIRCTYVLQSYCKLLHFIIKRKC
jgi:hypothetical protein